MRRRRLESKKCKEQPARLHPIDIRDRRYASRSYRPFLERERDRRRLAAAWLATGSLRRCVQVQLVPACAQLRGGIPLGKRWQQAEQHGLQVTPVG
eukprot:scaffold23126_cov241-Isochrysis_galbana.AAC.12